MTDTPIERAGETTWARLRRRKVVQWGLAYAAGAWLLLQVLGFAADTFAWPTMAKQLAMLGVVVGFPVSVTLAWYHGDRGQQRVSASELAVLTLLLLVGGGLLWLYAQRSTSTTNTATAGTPAPASTESDARPSIAVLPLENRSDVQKDAFFVDGIHDDILTQLSKVSALRVISRTSVERFRQSELSLQQIAEQLGVKSILEGGVQRAGNRVRINVQLIDAATDAHVWAETYEAYQLGKQRMASRTSAALTEAERHFRSSVALDSRFALAWVGLADTLAMQTFYSGRPRDAGLAAAEQAVARALALDPGAGEAWASAGHIAWTGLQYVRAEEALRRAVALNPNYAPAYHWLSITLVELGRRNEALAMAESAAALDPSSAVINVNLGTVRRNAGRFDEALVALARALQIDPTIPNGYSTVAFTYAQAFGQIDTALPWFEKAASLDPGNPDLLANVAHWYWQLGDDAEAGRWLARTLETGEELAFVNAVAANLYSGRGDFHSAHRHAQRAAELDPWYLAYIRDFDLRTGDPATVRARYAAAFPNLLAGNLPALEHDRDALAAVELAVVLQATGEKERAKALLEAARSTCGRSRRWGTCDSTWLRFMPCAATRTLRWPSYARLRRSVCTATGATTETSLRSLRRSESSRSSRRSSPTSRATWRRSGHGSQHGPRTRRLSSQKRAPDGSPSPNAYASPAPGSVPLKL